jgi:hypothetical protein
LTRKISRIYHSSLGFDLLEKAFTGLTRREITEMQKVHEHIIENVESLLKKPPL